MIIQIYVLFVWIFPSVDIWSVGCIMAEMLLGKPLFKGNDRILPCRKNLIFILFLCTSTYLLDNMQLWFWCSDYVPKSHPQCIWILDHSPSDLDQLMEIMKITGTPTKEFTAKLQSEDVRFIHIFLLRLVCRTLSTYIMNTFEMWKSKSHGMVFFLG